MPSNDGDGGNSNDPESMITGTPCSCSRAIRRRKFAVSEMEVDEGYVRSVLGEQALGLGRSRGRTGYFRSQKLK